MRLQAGEGQTETRGHVRKMNVSVCGSSWCHGPRTGNKQLQWTGGWTHSPSMSIAHPSPSQHSFQWAHCSHFGKEDLNKLRNRNSWAVFEEYSCISHYGDWIAEAERLPLAQGFNSKQQQNQLLGPTSSLFTAFSHLLRCCHFTIPLFFFPES